MPEEPNPAPLMGRRTLMRSMLLAAVALPLAACSVKDDPLAQQAKAGDNKNYIAGDGAVQEYSVQERGEPVELNVTTYQGTKIDFADYAGSPVVLNFWYAACAPCRIEAPHLRKLNQDFAGKANFLGVNVRDEKEAALAFERNFEIPYESVQDTSGQIQLAMTQYVPLQAVPTTLVLDRNGKVRARVVGAVNESTLRALIQAGIDEKL